LQLILLRHGQSAWNQEERFTGWANVGLTRRGEESAIAAGALLSESGVRIDLCYTSVLQRAARSAELAVERWVGANATRVRPQIVRRWRLNERHYGSLTGLSKREAVREMDPAVLREWRTSFQGAPPPMEPSHRHYSRLPHRYARLLEGADGSDEPLALGDVPLTESLADCVERVRPLWLNELRPAVLDGQTVLVVGHANCMRALISCLQPELSDADLPSLGVPNALPLIYSFDAAGEPLTDLPGRCYIEPLHAHYLGDECVAFNSLDTDGSGALDVRAAPPRPRQLTRSAPAPLPPPLLPAPRRRLRRARGRPSASSGGRAHRRVLRPGARRLRRGPRRRRRRGGVRGGAAGGGGHEQRRRGGLQRVHQLVGAGGGRDARRWRRRAARRQVAQHIARPSVAARRLAARDRARHLARPTA
jgi:2,3-bisphosphoglycerate-dependent phosphoglycerate mutase